MSLLRRGTPWTEATLNTFITQRWRGRIGWRTLFWRTLFWRDLLLIGTSLNLLMTGSAVALLSQGAALPWVLLEKWPCKSEQMR